MRRYTQVKAEGLTFSFAHDRQQPTMLHIYVRHLTSIDDALGTWFDTDAEEIWNPQYRRFETRGFSHVVYWTWLAENERVLIITCFTRED
jgi:hypothetical protein